MGGSGGLYGASGLYGDEAAVKKHPHDEIPPLEPDSPGQGHGLADENVWSVLEKCMCPEVLLCLTCAADNRGVAQSGRRVQSHTPVFSLPEHICSLRENHFQNEAVF